VADIATAPDAASMARLLDDVLIQDDLERRRARSQAAASHSWDRRLEEIAEALSGL
jgi:hypothetical protein